MGFSIIENNNTFDMIYININGKYDASNVATNTYAQFTQTPASPLNH